MWRQGILVAVVMTFANDVRADSISIGSHDVETVFFIDKSIGRNRVDYGIHLDDRCTPVNDGALFPYWRMFEISPTTRTSLGMFENVGYGLSEQRLVHRTPTGGDQMMRLKQVDRAIVVTTKKEADGHCSATAHARVAGVEGAVLTSVHVKLAGALSVDYIDVHGKHPQTGADLVERVHK